MNTLSLLGLGALIGVPLGYAMQRTHLCFNSAYRFALLHKDFTLLRLIGLAILVQMVGLYALVQFGVGGVRVNVVPFFWLANIAGGFVFGVAMTFAEGCSSTVWYRVGNGNLGALVALVGFALGEWAMLTWDPLAALRGFEIRPESGAHATLPNVLGVSPWLVVAPLAIAGLAWLARTAGGWRARPGPYGGWDWRWGGLALGAIATAAWVVAWPTGWHYGVGIVGATGPWVRVFYEGASALNWGSFMVLTLPLGALLAALRHREFRWQVPDLPSTARMGLAGAIMGMSATFAGGCNIGHGFTGLPTLALSSVVATLFTFMGTALGVYWRFVRPRLIVVAG